MNKSVVLNIGLMNEANVTDDVITRESPFEGIVEFLFADLGDNQVGKVKRGAIDDADVDSLFDGATVGSVKTFGLDGLFGMSNTTNITVVTTESMVYGAAAILETQELRKRVGEGKYYAIPSSVHEWLLVPMSTGLDAEQITEMIREINGSIVSPDERLADHVYKIEL